MTPDAAVTTAQRVGSADTATLLALVCLVLGIVVVWLWRDNARLNRELLAAHVAAGSDKERLLTIQITREGTVTSALDAITELPPVVRAIPDAVRAVVVDAHRAHLVEVRTAIAEGFRDVDVPERTGANRRQR